MKSIFVKSPTRIDLAGGTLDLWPLYLFVGGATTINVAIDIYTQVEIQPQQGAQVEIISTDLNLQKSYPDLKHFLQSKEENIRLFQSVLRVFQPKQGFVLKTSSQSPVGGGLGGSSSLTISLMRAFSQFCGKPMNDVHQLVNMAHHLEAEVLHTPTGTQDYYPAATGGLNILKYSSTGIEQKLSKVWPVLKDHMLLVYTGRAHHSGLNNFEVMKAAVQKDKKTLELLTELKNIAEDLESVSQTSKWSRLGALFQREYEARVQLSPAFTCPEIEKLNDIAKKSGAEALKICGAGGGGCVMVWSAPTSKAGVASACEKAGFKVLNAQVLDPISESVSNNL